MHKPLRSYLRFRRRESGLSQKELAALIGISRKTLSDHEREVHPVSARLLIAVELIFGIGAVDTFPGLYRDVEDHVTASALALHRTLEGREDEQSLKKRRLLTSIPNRVSPLDV